MNDQLTIRLLKIAMFSGIALIIFGHYLWVGAQIHLSMGIQGIMIIAGCCALGVILSLPTKIYLTILLMAHEEHQQAEQKEKDKPLEATSASETHSASLAESNRSD